MKIETLHIKTLTPLGGTNNSNFQNFVCYGDFVYFINPYKLDEILSLLKLLFEFNEYTNFNKNPNITTWLKSKNIITHELLNEISYYKIKNTLINENTVIKRFFIFQNIVNCNFSFENYIIFLLKNNFINAILYDFLSLFNDKFNDYFSDLLKYFLYNPNTFSSNFEIFSDYLVEIDKYKLQTEIEVINKMNIECVLPDDFSKYIILKQKSRYASYLLQECVDKNCDFVFKIKQTAKDNKIFNLEKYIQIFEYLNTKRLCEEKNFANIHALISKNENKSQLINNNFSFLERNQLLYLCLNNRNKKLLFDNPQLQKIFVKNICNNNPYHENLYDLIMPSPDMNYAIIKNLNN